MASLLGTDVSRLRMKSLQLLLAVIITDALLPVLYAVSSSSKRFVLLVLVVARVYQADVSISILHSVTMPLTFPLCTWYFSTA